MRCGELGLTAGRGDDRHAAGNRAVSMGVVAYMTARIRHASARAEKNRLNLVRKLSGVNSVEDIGHG
jgi:hypothetical protein